LFFKDAAKIIEQVVDDFDNYLVDQAIDMEVEKMTAE
jgi:hypothetical protein